MIKTKLFFAIFALATAFTSNAAADMAIIVNPNSAVTKVSSDEVKRLYLGKTKSLDDGTRLNPIDHVDGSAIKQEFYDKVVGKPLDRIKVYWSRLTFSGHGRPPETLGDSAKIKAWVAGNSDAIGYIDTTLLDGSVRAVLTVK